MGHFLLDRMKVYLPDVGHFLPARTNVEIHVTVVDHCLLARKKTYLTVMGHLPLPELISSHGHGSFPTRQNESSSPGRGSFPACQNEY